MGDHLDETEAAMALQSSSHAGTSHGAHCVRSVRDRVSAINIPNAR